jgi:hypothetical protein
VRLLLLNGTQVNVQDNVRISQLQYYTPQATNTEDILIAR